MTFADFAYIDTPSDNGPRYIDFTWRGCANIECENHHRGGSKYLCYGWTEEIAGRSRRWLRRHRHEFELCPSCVYEYHYGERPE